MVTLYDEGGGRFPKNTGKHLQNHTASTARRQKLSTLIITVCGSPVLGLCHLTDRGTGKEREGGRERERKRESTVKVRDQV
jgi:hypothetical protein